MGVSTPSVLAWINQLKWTGLPSFLSSPRVPFYAPAAHPTTSGFVQRHLNLRVFSLLHAGHMSAHDAPWTTRMMMRMSVQPDWACPQSIDEEEFFRDRRIQMVYRGEHCGHWG